MSRKIESQQVPEGAPVSSPELNEGQPPKELLESAQGQESQESSNHESQASSASSQAESVPSVTHPEGAMGEARDSESALSGNPNPDSEPAPKKLLIQPRTTPLDLESPSQSSTPEGVELLSESGAALDLDPAGPSEALTVEKKPVLGWEELGLAPDTLEWIRKKGFATPTPIQQLAVPEGLKGRDVIGSAQTGTGKTLAFGLPLVEKLAGRKGTLALVLGPTREIVLQIYETLLDLGKDRGLRAAVLIGGVDYSFDATALASYPEILVATPGRLCDHIERGNVWLEFIEVLVLDEADRMLDMGFSTQLGIITDQLQKSRQTMFFSATFTPQVEALARKVLQDPVRITVGQPMAAAKTVAQFQCKVDEAHKMRRLRDLIRTEPGSCIVFARSKDQATRIWRSLHSAGFYDATFIHSDRLQADREKALADFKAGTYRVLVATDVAARGIHVDGVAHVINYDLPRDPEEYVHRIGRTGRAEASGKATTFVTPRDRAMIRSIEKLIGKPIPEVRIGDREEGHSHSSGEVHLPSSGQRGGRRHESRGQDASLLPSTFLSSPGSEESGEQGQLSPQSLGESHQEISPADPMGEATLQAPEGSTSAFSERTPRPRPSQGQRSRGRHEKRGEVGMQTHRSTRSDAEALQPEASTAAAPLSASDIYRREGSGGSAAVAQERRSGEKGGGSGFLHHFSTPGQKWNPISPRQKKQKTAFPV